ncbi:MAG: LapA family protein [Deltaproteobacteria bacterium]|nr:LapA family protein [Deltaproteobacteria bacterium]MBW2136016.1 LapA family protein [Deltaproteobacteria bacterium]
MQDKSGSTKKSLITFKNIVFLILIILLVIFVVQNTQSIEVAFWPWKVSLPSALILLGAFFIGLVIGWLAKRTKPGRQDRKE